LIKSNVFFVLVAALLVASCTSTSTAPVVTPQGDDRYLVDPRMGWETAIPPAVAKRFDAAWRFVLAGSEAEARRRLGEIAVRNPGFAPVDVAAAALDMKDGRLDAALATVTSTLVRHPGYLAAQVYEAELAVRMKNTRTAYDLYRELSAQPNAPVTASERVAQLRETLFNELYVAAQSAAPAESARLLREALAFNPGALEPRILLAHRLIEQGQFEEARREIDPVLTIAADRPETQAILAEVEVGRGRHQEAIVRYERLAKRTKNPHYERRLAEIKRDWQAANMPPHVREAMNSEAVTRAELATLLYWTVPAIRFAQNVGAPTIAVDIEEVAGRDEIIRAIALGLFDVDPVTRRVMPLRVVTASRLSSFLTRVLNQRRAACAQGAGDRALAACSIPDPLATHPPDAPVAGRDVVTALEQIAKQL